jgi:serine/threonine protein kinase
MLPLTPTKLGRYEIVEEIGKGAMGVVFLARDPLIGRLVALKTFRIGYSVRDADLEQFRARFIREAQSAGILSHPNIVTIHDVVERSDDGLAFIAMEYVRGTNLKAVLQEDSRPTLPYVTDIVAQIADALDYAHSCKVIHRDIKPANILITADQRVKITDFGIARLDTSNLTQEGQLLGTPNYMAPEQILGRDVDGRADIFSLGVVLYEMLTRHKPFQGENLTVVSHRIVYDHFTPPRDYISDLPPGVESILTRALEKDPARRYQRARDMAEDLRRILAEVSPRDMLNETQSLSATAIILPARVSSERMPTAATAVGATPESMPPAPSSPAPVSPDAPTQALPLAAVVSAAAPVEPAASATMPPPPARPKPSFLRRLLPTAVPSPTAARAAAPAPVPAAKSPAVVTAQPPSPVQPAAIAPPPSSPSPAVPADLMPTAVIPKSVVAQAAAASAPNAPATPPADAGRFVHATRPPTAPPPPPAPPALPGGVLRVKGSAAFSTTPLRVIVVALVALIIALAGVAGFRFWVKGALPDSKPPAPAGADQPQLVALLQEGRRLLDSGDPRSAAAVYREAQQLAPDRASIKQRLEAAEKLAADRDKQAGEEKTIADRLDDAHKALADRHWDDAEKAGQDVLQLSPGNTAAQDVLASVATARQRMKDRSGASAQTKVAGARPDTSVSLSATALQSAPQKAAADSAPSEAAKDATLQLAFFSQLPEGSLMVYLNGKRILLESFRFYEKGGLFRPKPSTGWVRKSFTVAAGTAELRVYVTAQGRAAEVRNLNGNFLGGATRKLDVQLNDGGQVSASLN